MKKRNKALVLLLAAALLAALLAGCGGSAGPTNMSAAAGESWAPETPSASPEEIGWDDSAEYDYGSAVTNGTDTSAVLQPDPSRKIIYTATLTLESTEYEQARSALLSAAAAAGGYVERSSQYGSAEAGDRWVELTLRIPSDHYNDFLTAAENAASLLRKDESTQDITAEYVDVAARLKTLRTQEQRLQELAEQAETLEDLLAIEQRLSDVQYQIESYTAQQRVYDDQIDYSTVTVTLNEVRVYTPTKRGFGSRIVSAFQNSWSDFGEDVQDFVVGLVYALPALLLLGVIVVVVLIVVRKGRKKAAARKAERAERAQQAKDASPDAAGPGEDGPDGDGQPPKYSYHK